MKNAALMSSYTTSAAEASIAANDALSTNHCTLLSVELFELSSEVRVALSLSRIRRM